MPAVILAYAGFGVFVVVSLVIGIRLLLLWRRTRRLPELLIGLSFLLEGVITNVTNVLGRYSDEWPDARAAIHVTVVVSACVGAACLAVGAWRVFRPHERWARNLLILCLAGLGAYAVDSSLPHGGVYGPRNLAWWWIGVSFRAAAHGWMSLEAFLYSRMMARRARLGLGDPVVADRMWLWSVGGLASTLIWLAAGVARTVGGPAGLQEPLTLGFIGAMGLVSSAASWLAFLPPDAYLRTIERRAAKAA